ncbi:MAG: ATP-binding protein [Myxococcaceae bacterium]
MGVAGAFRQPANSLALGEGIHPRHLRHLFQRFFSTRRAGDGTGLGLTLGRRIVQRHQGRMEVATEEGRDSTFSVFLPLRLRVEPPGPWQPPPARVSA